jgi:carboxylesterase
VIETDYCSLIFSTPPGVEPQGTVLLIHGLTACPDEMRELAEQIHEKGYEVRVPCLAGHGTDVANLSKIRASSWHDDVLSVFSVCSEQMPVYVGGASFGALFSLMLAIRFPALVSGVFLLAPPIVFRSRAVECFCRLFSVLPEVLIDRLGSLPKSKRGEGVFVRKRRAYKRHSLSAVVRMFKVRNSQLENLSKVTAPVVVLQDPEDHHVSLESIDFLKAGLSNTSLTVEWIPNGEHELTVGKQATLVSEKILAFLEDVSAVAGVEEEFCQER